MSDPDQEEMRRKRLARLSAMSGGGGQSPASAPVTPVVVSAPVVAPVLGDKTETVECMEVDTETLVTTPLKRNRTTSSANYESSPAQIMTSLQNALSITLPGSEPGTAPGSLSCPQATGLSDAVSTCDLIGPLLAEAVSQQSVSGATRYLLLCFSRLGQEEAVCGKRAQVPPLSTVVSVTRSSIVSTLASVLRHVWHKENMSPHQSPLYQPLADDQVPPDLLECLVSTLSQDTESFSAVFSPLINHCLAESLRSSLVKPKFQNPLMNLSRLLSVKTSSGSRPVADLLVSSSNWLPDILTKAGGAEIVSLSFLGPFLSATVFPEEDSAVATHYLSGDSLTVQQVKTATGELQPTLEMYRNQLHHVFHSILSSKSSRSACLDWLAAALNRNSKRQQLQTNERLVAGDGFMLNLLSTLQLLSSKVKQDKVDTQYLYTDKCRVDTSEDSRLKASSQDFKEFSEKLEKGKEANFPTECWWLTLYAHHVAVLPIIRRYQRRLRALRELQKMVDELEKTEQAWKNHPSAHQNRKMLKKWKQQIRKQSISKTCADIGLLDESLFSRCISFYTSVCEHMMRLLDPDNHLHPQLQPNQDPPQLFKLLPEWVVDDLADFLLFGLQFMPASVSNLVDNGIVTWLLVSLSNTQHFANPYLVSKLVEILFVVNPSVQDKTSDMYNRIMGHVICQESLPSSLMRFYTEVEQTGSSNEFYDKFTIRYHISIIIKSMWDSPVHKHAIIQESQDGRNFIKFINMMMNDTTFLLDESLDALKRIHDVQDDMSDPVKWSGQSQEQQTSRARQLSQDERQCRSYLTLARETVDMFHYLTQDIQTPFLRPELADRLAAMLDHVLEQLTNGPKCKNLKVKNPEKYGWDPKWLLSHLIDIYLHLDSEALITALANDQRSFKLETFHDTAVRMENTLSRTLTDCERFKSLGERANRIVIEKLKQEEEWENYPAEFECAIMGELMEDPVKLPSGNCVERKNIERHILSTPNDPFSRQHLTEDMLVPDQELKQRIEQWKQEQREKNKK